MVGLPKNQKEFDAIWVIVDRLTKVAHFLPIRIYYPLDKLSQLCVDDIVRLHGIPVAIISNRDPRFTSRFWGGLQCAIETKLIFGMTFDLQTDGQQERTI